MFYSFTTHYKRMGPLVTESTQWYIRSLFTPVATIHIYFFSIKKFVTTFLTTNIEDDRLIDQPASQILRLQK